jgi:uncharacterized LabA/DUF88 family protein
MQNDILVNSDHSATAITHNPIKLPKISHDHSGDIPNGIVVLFDDNNITSSFRFAGKIVEWRKLLEYVARDRPVLQAAVFVGLPPVNAPELAQRYNKKYRFVDWLYKSGFVPYVRQGYKIAEGKYNANVNIFMVVEAIRLCEEYKPNTVVLVTGDNEYVPLVVYLKSKGIRVEVTSLSTRLGLELSAVANERFYLDALLEDFATIIPLEDPDTNVMKEIPSMQ